MNVIFTCGGTGGHINPAIAVANLMKERHPDCNILFIGAKGHMEEKLVPQAGYELRCLPGSGLSRKLNWDGIKKNVNAVKNVLSAVSECRKIIKEFKPDVIMGTGCYASFPALFAGSTMGIPTCIHESNAVPGLTNKLIANRASSVLVAFPESARHYKNQEKVEVVGMPVRKEFILKEKTDAKRELGLDERPVVVSAFGSLGARMMNFAVADMFKMEKEDKYPFQHIHATGSFGWEWMPEHMEKLDVDVHSGAGIDMREYIYNMPTVMAAADIIISRAGASTCNEIGASGTPCILIPSPNVTDNHQEKNARVLEAHGAAIVITEDQCNGQVLYNTVQQLLADHDRRSAMSAAVREMVILDSAERICDILETLSHKNGK